MLVNMPVLQADEKEQTLKLAIALKVARFVQTHSDNGKHYTIAIAKGALDRGSEGLLKGLTVHKLPVSIEHIERPEQVKDQQMLLLPKLHGKSLKAWLHAATSQHVLTISDMRGFAEAGGMVQLYKASRRFRLKINLDAVRQGGLKIRSRLLKIAEIIRRGRV